MSGEFVYSYKCPSCGISLPMHIRVTSNINEDKTQQQTNIQIEEELGKTLAEMCNISVQEDGTVIVKPKRYLGKGNFKDLAGKVKAYGGEYVGSGKEGYFRIPNQKRS